MAPVADLKSVRFIKEGSEIGSSLIEQAKREIKIEPKDASKTLVTAWVVLNAVSAICHRNRMHTQAAKIETMRQRIRFMAGELATAGYHLVTDVPDSQVAVVVTPKKPEEV